MMMRRRRGRILRCVPVGRRRVSVRGITIPVGRGRRITVVISIGRRGPTGRFRWIFAYFVFRVFLGVITSVVFVAFVILLLVAFVVVGRGGFVLCRLVGRLLVFMLRRVDQPMR